MDWSGFNELEEYARLRQAEYDRIDRDRKEALLLLGKDIGAALAMEGEVKVIFICTHNSRRSHMGQLWAQLASESTGLKGTTCYSGGTESTAFHPLAVQAMRKAGFRVRNNIPGSNPIYRVELPGAAGTVKAFSKKYTDPPNPTRDFIAVMTCSDADKACPIVHGASKRHAIRYKDPKVFDGTPSEKEGYDERCRQIAREMFYLFSTIPSAG